MKIKSLKIEIQVDGEEKPIYVEYGGNYDIDVDISQSREVLRGYRGLSMSEHPELCFTGEGKLELRATVLNRDLKAKAEEFKATHFDVAVVERPR